MNLTEGLVVAVLVTVTFALCYGGYRGYQDRQVIETVHVHVTSKGTVQGTDSIIHVNENYSQIVPGEIHYVVYTTGEAFEVSEDLFGAIVEGDQTWKVSGVKGSFWTKRRRIVSLQ